MRAKFSHLFGSVGRKAKTARRRVRSNSTRLTSPPKAKNWKRIASFFEDRTDVQCLHRWQKVLNPSLVKGPWSEHEDQIVMEMVHKHGPRNWTAIAASLPGRIGKQCRER